MEINTKTNTDNTNSTAPTGAEQEQTTAKTFTQDEVNSIVSERLKRERESIAKQLEQREKELQAKENVFACKEWLNKNGYPTELTEFFNAENKEDFITRVSGMVEKYPNFYKTAATASEQSEETAPTGAEQNGGEIPNGFHKVNSTLNSFHPFNSEPIASPLREDESGKIRRAFGID